MDLSHFDGRCDAGPMRRMVDNHSRLGWPAQPVAATVPLGVPAPPVHPPVGSLAQELAGKRKRGNGGGGGNSVVPAKASQGDSDQAGDVAAKVVELLDSEDEGWKGGPSGFSGPASVAKEKGKLPSNGDSVIVIDDSDDDDSPAAAAAARYNPA